MNELLEKSKEILSFIATVWNYELVVVDGGAITAGKIILAVLLAFIGYSLSRRISARLRAFVIKRFNVAQGASAAVESLSFYILLLFFVLFALKLANVPLTIFTVLGGAVAIGIGFGSQNIMNNFISGIIMLIEQPIRVGDLIEIDGLVGTVLRIGPRSTLIRTGTNIDLIIPNSSFLEKNVINWTLSDQRVRLKVSVGIAYGSSTESAKELLILSAKNHPQVLKSPEPFVWFVDFGDNALVFEVHFWALINSTSSRMLMESDIRFEIERQFRNAGISIAFPQRDIHLDTSRPLDIKLIGNN
jgi:small-conductance mechanosensitive channel